METREKNQIVMDRWSKLLLGAVTLVIIGSVVVSFLRFVVFRDYLIETQVDCDPSVESCFVWECDPLSEEDGEACSGNPDEDTWYYKVIRKNAMNIPVCDPNIEECEPLSCAPGEPECEYSLCEEGNEDGVRCSTADDAAIEVMSDGEEVIVEQDAEDILAEGVDSQSFSPSMDAVVSSDGPVSDK